MPDPMVGTGEQQWLRPSPFLLGVEISLFCIQTGTFLSKGAKGLWQSQKVGQNYAACGLLRMWRRWGKMAVQPWSALLGGPCLPPLHLSPSFSAFYYPVLPMKNNGWKVIHPLFTWNRTISSNAFEDSLGHQTHTTPWWVAGLGACSCCSWINGFPRRASGWHKITHQVGVNPETLDSWLLLIQSFLHSILVSLLVMHPFGNTVNQTLVD